MKNNIIPELLSARQISEYLGGNIGEHKVRELMENGILPSVIYSGKKTMLARRTHVDKFLDVMFSTQIDNNIIQSIPMKDL